MSNTIESTPVNSIPAPKPMWRVMFLFLIPLILSNALQSIGQLFGTIVVGRWLGVDALAAITAFFPMFFLLVSFTIGIGAGSSILIGQAFGAGNQAKMKAIVGTTLSFTFLLGVVLMALGGIFTWDLLRLVGTPENVISTTAHYARILLWMLPVMFLYFVYTTLLRGTGDSKTPFYLLVVSTTLNVVLLPIFIFGWLGIPRMGIYGAAWSTVISTTLALVVMFVWLARMKHTLRFDSVVRKHLRIDWTLLKLILKLGIPSSVGMILVSLSEIAVISFVNRFGSNATAAYGAVNQVASYVQMPAISLGMAVSIFAAQAIGANQTEKLKSVHRAGIALNYIMGGVLVVLVYVFSKDILSWFLTDAATMNMAHTLLVITLWSYLIFGHAQVIASFMRASGTVWMPLLFGVMSIWLVEVPVAYVLSHFTGLGIDGIWMGYPAAFAVSLLLQYLYYEWSWKKKTITRLV